MIRLFVGIGSWVLEKVGVEVCVFNYDNFRYRVAKVRKINYFLLFFCRLFLLFKENLWRRVFGFIRYEYFVVEFVFNLVIAYIDKII